MKEVEERPYVNKYAPHTPITENPTHTTEREGKMEKITNMLNEKKIAQGRMHLNSEENLRVTTL